MNFGVKNLWQHPLSTVWGLAIGFMSLTAHLGLYYQQSGGENKTLLYLGAIAIVVGSAFGVDKKDDTSKE